MAAVSIVRKARMAEVGLEASALELAILWVSRNWSGRKSESEKNSQVKHERESGW